MAASKPVTYKVDPMEENGMKQADLYCCIYNLYKAVYAICANLDDDATSLGSDYVSCIGTPLASAMSTALGTPHTSRASYQTS